MAINHSKSSPRGGNLSKDTKLNSNKRNQSKNSKPSSRNGVKSPRYNQDSKAINKTG